MENVKLLNFLHDFLTSSSSEDEEIEVALKNSFKTRNPKVNNYVDEVNQIPDEDFQNLFRVSRQTYVEIVKDFKTSKFYPSNRPHGGKPVTSAEAHILAFLWFAGNECSIREVAERFSLSISTCDTILTRVMDHLSEIAPTKIKFPQNTKEKKEVTEGFMQIAGLTGVIGCIESSQFNIRTPVNNLRKCYANKNKHASLALQVVCDYQQRFLDVFTGVPGKIQDIQLFHLSPISSSLPDICESGTFHILGDGTYYLRNYLLTPYEDYRIFSTSHQTYNDRLQETRHVISSAIGLLKGRFKQLKQLDFQTVFKMCKFIMSCCVLHNICIDCNDIVEIEIEYEVKEETTPEDDEDKNSRQLGEEKREELCLSLF